jgi:hypothetical protein
MRARKTSRAGITDGISGPVRTGRFPGDSEREADGGCALFPQFLFLPFPKFPSSYGADQTVRLQIPQRFGRFGIKFLSWAQWSTGYLELIINDMFGLES